MRIESATFTVSQEVDSCGPAGADYNEMVIEFVDSGCDNYYAVISTDRWAIDIPGEETKDVTVMLNRIMELLK